ncbi:MAG: hypothetical protein PWQ17_2564 [Anaerophaga sp.]|nr:hypothetical protein [Anaerophaga sp.]
MDSSTQWINSRLNEHDEVIKTEHDQTNNWLIVSRKKGSSFTLAVMSEKIISVSDIPKNFQKEGLNFLVNIPKEPYVHGNVFESLQYKKICFGGVGDLFRFINQEYNWPYENPEVRFILRGVSQHNKVSSIKRIDSRRYEIERYSEKKDIVLALNDYDLSAESVRNGKELYKDFNIILTSNPNARVTSDAYTVAKDINVRIMSFGQLLGYLKND